MAQSRRKRCWCCPGTWWENCSAGGVKAIVIACNTATSAAAVDLRAEYSDLPIIAMESALKPASLLHSDGVVLSLATPGTIAGEKYAHLYALYGKGVVSLPCPGLMEFVERGDTGSEALKAYLREKLAPYLANGQTPAAVVLGCTHYVFLKKTVQSLLPAATRVLDGNEGTVRQLRRRLDGAGLLSSSPRTQAPYELLLNAPNAEEIAQKARLLLAMPE